MSGLRNITCVLICVAILPITASAAGDADTVAEFELVDNSGNTVSHMDYRGQYVLLAFGFTNCPHVCPMMAANMAGALKNVQQFCEPVNKLPSEYLKTLYFDSLIYTTENLRHLIDTVGASQVVIGTDFPFGMGVEDAIDHVLSVPGLSAEEQQAILGGTAASLLGIS